MNLVASLRTRYRAGGAYLALSIAVTLCVFAVIYFVFYPWGLFETVGGLELFFLIALIALVIGPLLVTIVFVPGKKGLVFDLVVIASLQVATLAYGLHVLYLSRPAYIVFVKDRFELVRANEISEEERVKATRFRDLPPFGPRLVSANLPKDPRELTRLMFAWATGADLQHFPQYYADYADARGAVRAKQQPIGALRELNPSRGEEIAAVLRDIGRPESEVAWLPFKGDKRELAAFVNAPTGDFIRVAPLQPWK